jgi:hypothetical protein
VDSLRGEHDVHIICYFFTSCACYHGINDVQVGRAFRLGVVWLFERVSACGRVHGGATASLLFAGGMLQYAG